LRFAYCSQVACDWGYGVKFLPEKSPPLRFGKLYQQLLIFSRNPEDIGVLPAWCVSGMDRGKKRTRWISFHVATLR
jgi:hypothetical protein